MTDDDRTASLFREVEIRGRAFPIYTNHRTQGTKDHLPMTDLTRVALLFIPSFAITTLALVAAQWAIELISSAWVFNILQGWFS
jgi:hypothetical protein